jgi:hypothetical protein
MQRYFFLFVLWLTASLSIQAQIDDEIIDSTIIGNPNAPVVEERKGALDVENLFIGITFSALFGNFIFLDASPYVGYLLNRHVAVGIGGTYIYTAYLSNNRYVGDNVYGGRLFVNLRPLPSVRSLQGIYVHLEGEYLNHTVVGATGRLTREFVPAVNLGLGFNPSFENGFSVTTEVLVNALWFRQVANGPTPVYASPWQYRIGLYYAF